MFSYLSIENAGVFNKFQWKKQKRLNLLIGENGTGKTDLMKILYLFAKSLEKFPMESKSGEVKWNNFLSERMQTLFETGNRGLGSLVRRGSPKMNVEVLFSNVDYSFSIGRNTTHQLRHVMDYADPETKFTSLFIPADHILENINVFFSKNEVKEEIYKDIIEGINFSDKRRKKTADIEKIQKALTEIAGGSLILTEEGVKFGKGNRLLDLSRVSEGLVRIGLIALLLENSFISKKSILFFDFPENLLHPKTADLFAQQLFYLSKAGVQIYAAVNSPYVLKRFELLARRERDSVSLCSLEKVKGGIVEGKVSDLRRGIPPNPASELALELYREEIELNLS